MIYSIPLLAAMNAILLSTVVVAIIAAVLGIVIVLVFRAFAVPVDERVEDLLALMPGANCGGCGYSGCSGYAEALADGTDTDVTKCTAGGSDTVEDLGAYLGLSGGVFIPKVAYVRCQGTTEHTHKRYNYTGSPNCQSAHGLFSGPNSCVYGCMGFGDCVTVCDFGAITIEDGIAKVDGTKCVACGKCVTACPKDLIAIIPKHTHTHMVKCQNHWPGGQARRNCSVACIGCQRCVKACPSGAIKM